VADTIKINMVINKELLKKVDRAAKKENRTRSNFIETVLKERVERWKK
jgi:metal-responsive CopG/Arc/MetJ family transcriptional regulator